ncbi:alpha/beta fold hydrolase [Slackia heliotrinireducens]|uniref:alpha/beta fold hydrolase n=1 Tax=Slackia heliotrinireducens TaxID=84110 RepID=UPI003314B6CE
MALDKKGTRFALKVRTKRGPQLDGVLFCDTAEPADTVLVAITGIHGNFYSNPFYVTFGEALNSGGFDFVYGQTCDAFGQIETTDWRTGELKIIGSQTEDFADAVDDVGSYIDWAEHRGYKHIYLAGHSLGANKVIRYLSETHDPRVERFMLLSPANLTHMTSGTSEEQRALVREYMATGRAEEMLPFALMGWAPCVARTAHQWLFEPTLNNAHTEADGDFSQAERITHRGMLLVGTYDNFTKGDPAWFLENLNSHMPSAKDNELVFIERTGHTYQRKEQEVADVLLETVGRWRKEDEPCRS